ncbi:hypothetical protein NLC82_05400 [Candidatus Aminicenantes bacterium AC-335-A11]|jgi:hypothetical protein|nr:hypothetical protein [SCandidatus Aminicenantes bacterium Aminicenantia_JdfR_composite]MCP2597932.1 hypothetical protein [Candidatus Aminicenantes bacterium AC-335-L06]MCP2606086.1 hypothetical protein [Candidatus Aminicenantes bacterium AC-708-I09]MCP2618841.1 hypothetical protein [Candidatus Aminicenantes bacterium AC-335-A11]MCP2620887.1 hypothetical protein [Candidatus Aminicenantes bacterium AC-334-E05]
MKIIKRKWKPEEADRWTKEDAIAIIVSPIAYALLMIGLALSCFLLIKGFIILGFGIILTWFLHWVIDPKLKAISKEYEKKQRDFLKHLDNIIKWREYE